MKPGICWLAVVGICFLLIVPGVSALDLLQPKSKVVGMSWQDFQKSAMDMNETGKTISELEGAIGMYNTAEIKLKMQYDRAGKAYDADYWSNLHIMERDKAAVYTRLADMEQARANAAHTNAASYPSAAAYYEMASRNAEEYAAAAQRSDNNSNRYQDLYVREYNKEHQGGGCLIVTATYGSPLSSQVELVRNYRDGTIRQSYTGSQFFLGFNAWYYSFSPAVASYIATHPLVKSVMRICLVPLLAIVLLSQNLYAILGFSPEIATISVLLFGAAFYSLVYIFPPAFLTVWLAGRKGWKIPAPVTMKPVLIVWIFMLCGLAAGIVLSIDILTIVSSGLLVACTIFLIAGTGSLALMWYLKDRSFIR